MYNSTTNAPLRQLANNSVTCLAQPYNIEVRPCGGTPPPRLPVTITLRNGTNSVVRTQKEYYAPFFLWGDNTTTGDVFPSKLRLRNGMFRLTSTIGGTIQFTQSCP